ncbi:MAG: tetratricopeptide repeat protein [Candidatus Binataceae bacterium]
MGRSSWLFLTAALAATPAFAQSSDLQRQCEDKSADVAISACSEIIDNGGASTGTRIVASRQLASVYTLRGAAYARKRDYDHALQDLDNALKANPKYALALANRGAVYTAKGEFDRAIDDYTQAIALDPKLTRAYANRGNAYFGKQDDARAIADYDKALALEPLPRTARNRGNAAFLMGHYAEAAQDFRRALAMDPSDTYAIVWLRIAQGHAGAVNRDELASAAGKANLTPWPGAMVGFYLGNRSAEQVRAASASGEIQGEACEAAYYMGEAALTSGNAAGARPLLQEAVNTCPHDFVEYRSAVMALKSAP